MGPRPNVHNVAGCSNINMGGLYVLRVTLSVIECMCAEFRIYVSSIKQPRSRDGWSHGESEMKLK